LFKIPIYPVGGNR